MVDFRVSYVSVCNARVVSTFRQSDESKEESESDDNDDADI